MLKPDIWFYLSGYILMKYTTKLQIDHLSTKMAAFNAMAGGSAIGWVQSVRTALKMSFRQLGKRLGITAQSAQEIEEREINGTISLKRLREVAEAMDMKFVYGFVPREGSLDKIIEKQALAVAQKIVMRANTTMQLEDQAVSHERLEKSVRDLADEIKNEMPRYLWD
jgi:predicted DNA-binding mobile mystery protein A